MIEPTLSSPHRGRVILTYGRSLMALVIARSLAQRGIEVIGCDDVDLTVLSFSKHVKETFTVAPWRTHPEQFLEDLEAAVRDYAPRDGIPYVLMPVFTEGELIARHRDRFQPTVKLAMPSAASLAKVNPKDHFAQLVETAGLSGPRSWIIPNAEVLREVAPRMTYPLMVKPSEGTGGRGVSMAGSAEEAIEKVMGLGFEPTPMLQALAPGQDFCVAVLADHGHIAATMAYRNLTTFPHKAGAGALRETVDAEPFRAATEQLLQASEWHGLAEIDFRWTGEPADPPLLIEVNARFWAGIFHSIQTAVDFPWLLYQQTIGEPLDPVSEPHIGARTKAPGIWLLAALEDVAASDPRLAAAGEVWRTIQHRLKPEALADLRAQLAHGQGSFSVTEMAARLQAALSEAKGAPSDFTGEDDPLVGLGALFVLSSLIKHGKLPDELTYESGPPAPVVHRTRSRRPTIGVTAPDRGDAWLWRAMSLAIWAAGGRAVRLTALAPGDPHTIDGLVLGGGSDVHPEAYEAQAKPGYQYDLARGDMEASWLLAARRHDLPVLGVCRGAQVMNVVAGGTLHADMSRFEGHDLDADSWDHLTVRKPVVFRQGSRLREILGQDGILVNIIHQQAIDRLGVGLRVSGRQGNRTIQAIEDASRRFWIGVQYHPELMLYRAVHRRLFSALVEAARARQAERFGEVGDEPLAAGEAPATV